MKYLFFVAIIAVAGCLPWATVFSQARVHPALTGFSTAGEVRSEFETYEAEGKKCAQDERQGKKCAAISFSPEMPLNIPVQGRQGAEWLTFRVSISTPRSQVREMGYGFGKVARQRTPADRADILDRLVIRMQENPTTIVFVLRVIAQPDLDTSPPEFGFAIVNELNGKLWSTSRPDFSCAENDLICQVALKQSGQPVAFPLFTQPGNVPFVDDKMGMLRLVVIVDDHEYRIPFVLNDLR